MIIYVSFILADDSKIRFLNDKSQISLDNGVNRHCFKRSISGTNSDFVPWLAVEILEKDVHTPLNANYIRKSCTFKELMAKLN